MIRCRKRLEDEQAGLSLIELMVTMTLLIVVLGILSTTTITAFRTSSNVNARSQNANAIRVAVDRATRDLRQALPLNNDATSPFVQANKVSASFYTLINTYNSNGTSVVSGPTQVTFSVGNLSPSCVAPDLCLIETDRPSIVGTDSVGPAYVAGSTPVNHILLHYISGTSTTPIFAFYRTPNERDPDPSKPKGTPVLLAFDSSGNLSATDIKQVDTVDITLSVKNPSSQSSPATTVIQRVTLPNTDPVTPS